MKYICLIFGLLLITGGIICICNPPESGSFIYKGTACLSTEETCEVASIFGDDMEVTNIGQDKNLVHINRISSKHINHTFEWINESESKASSSGLGWFFIVLGGIFVAAVVIISALYHFNIII